MNRGFRSRMLFLPASLQIITSDTQKIRDIRKSKDKRIDKGQGIINQEAIATSFPMLYFHLYCRI